MPQPPDARQPLTCLPLTLQPSTGRVPPHDADPNLIWGVSPSDERPPDIGLANLVRSIHEVVLAERSLAKARHEEIMQRLTQDMEGLQSNFHAENEHLQLIENTLSQSRTHMSLDGGGCGSVTGLNSQENWSSRVSQVQHEANEKERVKELSKESQFEFGTKYTSEDSLRVTGLEYLLLKIRKICKHRWFELGVSAMITFNAFVMCFEVQHEGLKIGRKLQYKGIESYGTWSGEKLIFAFFDWFFGVVFILEAILKIVAFRLMYFKPGWNSIDFLCVVAFVVGKVSEALNIELVDAQTIRLIRLFRLARLIRLIRTLEKLDMLYIITTAIRGMKMIVVWAVALLSLILMTCALFLSEYLQSTYFDKDFDNLCHQNVTSTEECISDSELETYKELYKYFGSFSRCMLSMFELTLGNWPPVARLLTEEVSEWFGVFCLLHKLSIGFAVIGVINGVILQETFKVAHTDDMVMVRQKKRAKIAMQKKMEALFQALDYDKDGEIGFSEFMIIAAQPEVKLWLESLDIETDDLLTLFLLIDANGSGTLTLDELLGQVPRLRGAARGIDMLAVRKNIPSFQLSQDCDSENLYTWKENFGLGADMREAIGEAKFTWKSSASDTCASLDNILRRADTLTGHSPKSSKKKNAFMSEGS